MWPLRLDSASGYDRSKWWGWRASGYEPPLNSTPKYQTMGEDGVLQEVRAARDAYARSLGYEVRAMVADLRRRDERGDWPVVRLAPRRPTVCGDSRPNPSTEPIGPVTDVDRALARRTT